MSDKKLKKILQEVPVNLKSIVANEKFESSLKMRGVPVMDFFRKEETLEAVIKSLVETNFEEDTKFYEHLHKHLSSEIQPLHEILAEKDAHMATLIQSYSDRLDMIQIEKFIQEKCPIEPQETLEYYTVFNKCNEYELPDINDIFFNMD
ncbi:hypothetical protein M0812_06476 [Anaeramoeba flamelloides]|uniref:Uncharacterized protein n=1 Tax=Anaeramoeba flamelloides TaxID=1746091 RepID=A0AAV8A9J3_9EUKA|nr:hypothetical protein M0812_06476 [Anaeramoeba flamelloides]